MDLTVFTEWNTAKSSLKKKHKNHNMINYAQINSLFGPPLNSIAKSNGTSSIKIEHVVIGCAVLYLVYKFYKQYKDDEARKTITVITV
jgi:hypothetical protein